MTLTVTTLSRNFVRRKEMEQWLEGEVESRWFLKVGGITAYLYADSNDAVERENECRQEREHFWSLVLG